MKWNKSNIGPTRLKSRVMMVVVCAWNTSSYRGWYSTCCRVQVALLMPGLVPPRFRESRFLCDCEATILRTGFTNKAVKRVFFQSESRWDLRARVSPTLGPRSASSPNRRYATKEFSTPLTRVRLRLLWPKVQMVFYLISPNIHT